MGFLLAVRRDQQHDLHAKASKPDGLRDVAVRPAIMMDCRRATHNTFVRSNPPLTDSPNDVREILDR